MLLLLQSQTTESKIVSEYIFPFYLWQNCFDYCCRCYETNHFNKYNIVKQKNYGKEELYQTGSFRGEC